MCGLCVRVGNMYALSYLTFKLNHFKLSRYAFEKGLSFNVFEELNLLKRSRMTYNMTKILHAAFCNSCRSQPFCNQPPDVPTAFVDFSLFYYVTGFKNTECYLRSSSTKVKSSSTFPQVTKLCGSAMSNQLRYLSDFDFLVENLYMAHG